MTRRARESGMTTRLARTGVAACVVAIALAGCVGIPRSGGVNAGPLVGADEKSQFVEQPVGPHRGETRDEILSDFMQAVVSSDNDYGIARLYLTTGAAQVWDPTKSVLVREGSATTEDDANGSILYTVNTKAFIDDSGIYSEQSTVSGQSLSFSFEKVAGQWRISDLSNGIVIARDNLTRAFTAQSLYFFDPSFHFLVPDVRWFPTGATVPTRIVNALLGGPSPLLQGGVVVSAIPQGIKQQKAVEVHAGTAVVDLSSDAANLKPPVQAQVLRQLQSSLLSPSITGVSLSVAGAPLQVSPASANVAISVDSAALVLKGKKFGYWPKLTDIGQLSSQVTALNPLAVAVGRDQKTAAILAKNGVYLASPASPAAALVDSRKNLIAPSIDPYGYVWSVPANDASAIRVSGPSGSGHAVVSTLPSHSKIVSLQVSHDGTRVLLYLKTSAGPELLVAGVVRRTGNVPSSLGTPLSLPVSSAEPIDATWVDSYSVAALGESGGADTVISYEIGGSGGDPSTPVAAEHIVGGNGSLRLITSDDEVYQLRSSGWQELGVTAALLATQQ